MFRAIYGKVMITSSVVKQTIHNMNSDCADWFVCSEYSD